MIKAISLIAAVMLMALFIGHTLAAHVAAVLP
jgi:hypothetical protein